jgi:hypothetical protein
MPHVHLCVVVVCNPAKYVVVRMANPPQRLTHYQITANLIIQAGENRTNCKETTEGSSGDMNFGTSMEGDIFYRIVQ